MASVEIAGVVVEIESDDEQVVGVIATMLANVADEYGPCVLTRECNPEGELIVGGEPAVRVVLP